jgi:FtsZ-interacting cell division protein YlmF
MTSATKNHAVNEPVVMQVQDLETPDAIRSDRYIDLAMGSAKVLDSVLDQIADQHIEEPERFDEYSFT